MTKFKKIFTMIIGLSVATAFVACEKDTEEENGNDNGNAAGSYSLTLTGDDVYTIEGATTYEFDTDLLRIKFGNNPPEIVMNYSLIDGEEIIPAGVYEPVSATGTGMPDNSIAVQYNGDETYFGDSGTIEITASGNGEISGSVNAVLKSIAGNTLTVEGDFTAVQ